jgi:hypothetical protein
MPRAASAGRCTERLGVRPLRLAGDDPARGGSRGGGDRSNAATDADGQCGAGDRWGHVSETAYLERRRQLEELRSELTATAAPAPCVQVRGVGHAWEQATTAGRRQLTREFHASGLSVLGGKGGIRTLEGVSHPLPA